MNAKQTDKDWKVKPFENQPSRQQKSKKKKKTKKANFWNMANQPRKELHTLKTNGEQSSSPYTLTTRENGSVG